MALKKLTSILKRKASTGSTAKYKSHTSERGASIIRTGEHVVICVTIKNNTGADPTTASSKIVGRSVQVSGCKMVSSRPIGKLVEGYGSVFNLGKAVHTRHTDAILRRIGEESLHDDWHRIGDDIRKAMSTYAKGKP